MSFSYQYINNYWELSDLIEWHNKHSDFVVVDIETTGLDRFKDSIVEVAMCFSARPDTAVIIPADLKHCLLILEQRIVLHNSKFDLAFLHHNGTDLRGSEIHDTMLLHHLVDENSEHGLDALITKAYNDTYKADFWSLFPAYQDAPFSRRLEYSGKDVIYTAKLYQSFIDTLEVAGVPDSLIEHVHELNRTLLDTEINGIRLDMDYLLDVGTKLRETIEVQSRDILSVIEPEVKSIELDMWLKELEKRKTPKGKANVEKPVINLDSSNQLKSLLYDKLHLPVQKNQKTKKPSTDDAALENLKQYHPVVSLIQEYRANRKVYGSFIEGAIERNVGSRIYPTFNVNGTVTGRISSSNPNMQQLPREGGIRGIYIPDDGHKIITCDYGMLEVVIAAHFSHDKNLLKIVYEGASKHDITAQSLGIERQLAKTLNFAMQYQCSPRKVAELLKVSQRDAQLAWNKYWETYSGEKAVIEDCKRRVDNGEPIINPFGRRRHFPRKFDAPWEREAAYRQAYSAKIQGTGADLTNRAYYLVHDSMVRKQIGKAMFPVHDEIVIQAKENDCKEAQELLSSTMVRVGEEISLSVPLTVDCSEPKDRWEK